MAVDIANTVGGGGLWCGDTGGVDERVWHLYLGLNLSCIAYWPRNLSQVSQCLGASVSPSGNWVGEPLWLRADHSCGVWSTGHGGRVTVGGTWLSD